MRIVAQGQNMAKLVRTMDKITNRDLRHLSRKFAEPAIWNLVFCNFAIPGCFFKVFLDSNLHGLMGRGSQKVWT